MSIIQKIRDKAAVFLTSMIAISLIGFLVQDAFVGGTSGFFNGQASSVGSINGKKIDVMDFNRKVNLIEQNYRSQGMQTNEMMTQNIIENVWNNLVQEEIIKGETEKLGMTITPKELGATLFSDDAPQEFKQLFTDRNTGIFDVNAARNWFNNLKKNNKQEEVASIVEQLIKPIEMGLLTQKYASLFTQGSYVPKWMLEKMQSDNNGIASISFASIPYATIADTTIKVSDDEIKAYISKRKDEFKQERVKGIVYVSFSANPTPEDSAKVYNQLSGLKSELSATPDVKAFITRNNSSIPFFEGFVLKSKLQMAAKDSIIAMSNGGVIGPYLDGSNFVLARKVETRKVPDSVKCRHILIGMVDPQTGQPTRTDTAARKKTDSIFAAIRSGGDFGSLARTLSEDQGSKANGGEYDFTSTDMGNLAKEFADFVFYKPKGSMEIVKTTFGYHIIEVLNQKNFEDAYKVAYLSKPILASAETDASASNAATQFAGSSRDPKSFEANVAKMKLNKQVADNIRPLDFSAGPLSSRALVKWIYDNKVGEVSEPFDLKDQYVVAMITNDLEEGTQPAPLARVIVEPTLRNQKKAEIIAKKAGAEKNLEKIAQILGGTTGRADTVRFSDPFVPNLGNETKVIGAAFNKKYLSTTSDMIDGQAGVYYIKVEQVGALQNPFVDLAAQKKAMETQLKQYATYSTLESLRKSAKVDDKRSDAGY